MSDRTEAVSLARTLTGRVVSDKMSKSITVLVQIRKPHPKFKKPVTRIKKICAHNPENMAKKGDLVVIKECRKISKRKSWTLLKVQEKAVGEVESA